MSEARQDIKDTFTNIQGLSGQSRQYRTLDNSVDELIDHLNEFIQQSATDADKVKAEQAITNLLSAKDDDIAKVKLAEDELKGKGTTVAKERIYSRQLDSAIAAVESAIAAFL